MLKIENVSLKKKKVAILQQIDCEISLQKTTLLLGKSGSGKTSLLRCLAQLEREYDGNISIGGHLLGEISANKRSKLIGFVSQSYALFPHWSVLENCLRPLRTILGLGKKEAREKVEEMFAFLDIEKLASSSPHELSGGQQQRVAIARALVFDPLFLLLDEPTSALDPENTDRLIELLKKLQSGGRGVVIASQDMAFAAKIFDRALFLENGVLVETSDKEEKLGVKLSRFLCL